MIIFGTIDKIVLLKKYFIIFLTLFYINSYVNLIIDISIKNVSTFIDWLIYLKIVYLLNIKLEFNNFQKKARFLNGSDLV